MTITEIKTRTIVLNVSDIRQAIIMYMRGRGEKEVNNSNIDLQPETTGATITITEEIKAKDT